MAEADDPLVGRVVGGRYRIERRLGAGGMATVYLASDTRVRRQVVVKIPHAPLLQQPGFRERFQLEVRSLTELQHPGVVPLYDCGEDEEGVPWCAVRYLPGGDLADRMDRAGGRLPASEIAAWLPQVCETLDFIHAAGVLHRDVTPVNILFDENDNVFLSDFGVAAIVRAADETAADVDPRLTAEGTFVGSALYAPPEAVYRSLTPAYDQYSLALVLYHALCGYLPYSQIEPRSLMAAKNSEAPAPLDQRGVPIPPAAVHAVMRGLERDPEARFASCRELGDAFSGEVERDITQAIVLPEFAQGRGSRSAWRYLAAALLAVAAAAGAWLFLSGAPGEGLLPEMPEVPGLRHEAQNVSEKVISGRFQAGSTGSQIADALATCRRYALSCPPSLYDDERLRDVDVAPFQLDEHEVTNREFAAFVAATGHQTTAERLETSRDGPFEERRLSWRQPAGPRSAHEDIPDHPVVHVSASDAEAYCAWRGWRLPSEDEWELAARDTDSRVYPWGDVWDPNETNWAAGESARLRPVGSFPPGPFGHRDLTGNVWEWTATHQGAMRVLKGGSWLETNPADLRSAVRLVADPEDRSSDIGFRCARDVAQ